MDDKTAERLFNHTVYEGERVRRITVPQALLEVASAIRDVAAAIREGHGQQVTGEQLTLQPLTIQLDATGIAERLNSSDYEYNP